MRAVLSGCVWGCEVGLDGSWGVGFADVHVSVHADGLRDSIPSPGERAGVDGECDSQSCIG